MRGRGRGRGRGRRIKGGTWNVEYDGLVRVVHAQWAAI